jgi:hypothetical protein
VLEVPLGQIADYQVVEAFDLALSAKGEGEFGGRRGGGEEVVGGCPHLAKAGGTLTGVWLLGKCL